MSEALRSILAIFGTEVDDSGLKKGEKSVESFKGTLKEMGEVLLGAFAIHKIVDFTQEILESADVLAKQSQALNVSAADLQGWQWAAKLSGSSAEEFTSAFTKFNRNVAEASKGTGPAADALKALGITAGDIKGKLPIDLLDQVADGLKGVEDPGKRVQIIMALLGKSGAKLLPTFLEGSEGLKKLRGEVGALGASFDEDFLEQAQEVNDNIDRLKMGARGLAIQAIAPLLPLITEWTQKGVALAKGLIELVKHSEAVKAGLVTFGAIGAAKAITAMVSLAQKAGFLKNGLRGVLLELAPLVLGFLAIEDVWTFLTGGKSVTGDVIEKFFGKDAPAKVKAFVASIKDTGLADLAALLRDAFAIFTDGKPLDTKFKEFIAYIEGTFRPQLEADFGGVGTQISLWLELLTGVLGVFNKIATVMGWIADHANPFTKGKVAAANVAREGDEAHNNALANANPGRAPAAADFEPQGWAKKTLAWALGFKPEMAVPKDLRRDLATNSSLLPESVTGQLASLNPTSASAPVIATTQAPEINQKVSASVVQNFYSDTPEDVQKAASDGATKGVTKASDLLATQAAVSKKGG
jgi:hypothetical protein